MRNGNTTDLEHTDFALTELLRVQWRYHRRDFQRILFCDCCAALCCLVLSLDSPSRDPPQRLRFTAFLAL